MFSQGELAARSGLGGRVWRQLRWLAPLAVLVLGVVSCGGQDFEAGPLGAVEVAPGEAIQIRSMQVLTGLGDLGIPSQRGVELALADYGLIKGHAVSMGRRARLSLHRGRGRAAADTVTGDPRVVAAIGTSCSVAAAAASPILSEAGLVMLSPLNTSPSLTSDLRGNAGSNYYPGYYRTIRTTSTRRRRSLSSHTTNSAYVGMAAIHDGDPYTSGLTDAFTAAFEGLGGSVAVASVSRGDTNMTSVLTQIAADGPDASSFRSSKKKAPTSSAGRPDRWT